LIDGRPSSFSGGNGKSLLDAIPASSIERIEIVTNPSSKYSPDGTAGIINVVLKKNKLKGTNGLISSSIATDKLFNGNASFSYRNAKFNVYANYTYKYSEGYRNNYGNLKQIFTTDSSSLFIQDRIGTDFNASHTLRAGADFYLKPNQTLGFSITGSDGERNRTGNLKNKMYFNETTLTRNWERLSDDPSAQQNMDISLNYKIDLKDNKGTLTADIAQSLGTDDISGKYDETYYNLDGTISTLPTLHQSIVNFEKNNVSNAQMDYTRVYPEKGARIEMGVKSIVRNLGVNTVSKTLDNETQTYEVDSVANFVYEYNEQIYGAYAIYGRQIGKFKFQGGLRAEQAFQSPFLISTGEKFTNNYFQIYPSGHLKYNHKTNTEWSLSYSRRINRASSSDMNPFSSYADPYNLRKGNPNLKPEYINSIDVGYSVELPKVTLTTSVYARQTTDVIQRVKIFYPDNTSAITFANIDQSQSVGIELVATFKPVKWWKNVLSFNGNGIQYKDNTTGFNYNNSGFTWGAKYIGSVDFWKKTMVAVLNVNYVAPFVSAQGTGQRRGAVDVSTEKTFKGGKWAAGLRVTDIFNRQGFSLNLTQPFIEQNAEFKWLTRRLYFTLTYKFGKLEMSNKKPASEGGGGQDF
jgi:outer membrane receptor protein involved in Fe transport